MSTLSFEDRIALLNDGSPSNNHISEALKEAGQDPERFERVRQAIITNLHVRLDRCRVVITDVEEAAQTHAFFERLADCLQTTLNQLTSDAPYALLPNHVSGRSHDALCIPRCVTQNKGDAAISCN